MSTIAELVRANFREELVRWYRYRSSSSLPLDELYEHSPAARRYPRDRVLRRLVKIDNDFQCDKIIQQLDLMADDE
ncbi:TPA: hypothetical protein KAK57_001569 [Escherichia coli]|uniref:DUF7301 family protein n=2 Tax=Escherichia coli TaxID=562 RepID=UPI0006678118|nr:hypothetical protein [Escherichia coli]AKP85154.1 hypothetical protein J444_2459 [Escherichia coli ACN001]MCC5203643.1 hypothetical protein [Escherichia coli]MDD8874943.1 hypothetical protein [Escherichia coli]MDI4333897.1 hypothetical protein [Escherichia coli]MDI4355146.1 hypothetical protein [Escherichia coli]